MSVAKSIILCLASFSAGVTLAGAPPSQPPIAADPTVAEPATLRASGDAQSESPTTSPGLEAVNSEPLVRQASRLSTSNGGSGDGLALLINLGGALCANPIGARARGHHAYDVTCIETLDGKGRVRYAFNAVTGSIATLERAD